MVDFLSLTVPWHADSAVLFQFLSRGAALFVVLLRELYPDANFAKEPCTMQLRVTTYI